MAEWAYGKEIGYVFITANNRWKRHAITIDKLYGATCPGLFTTNGSCVLLAKWLASKIADAPNVKRDVEDYTVFVVIDGKRLSDEIDIYNALVAHMKP